MVVKNTLIPASKDYTRHPKLNEYLDNNNTVRRYYQFLRTSSRHNHTDIVWAAFIWKRCFQELDLTYTEYIQSDIANIESMTGNLLDAVNMVVKFVDGISDLHKVLYYASKNLCFIKWYEFFIPQSILYAVALYMPFLNKYMAKYIYCTTWKVIEQAYKKKEVKELQYAILIRALDFYTNNARLYHKVTY